MSKTPLDLQLNRCALAALLLTAVGCGGATLQVRTSVTPSPYARSTTFCVAPFQDAEQHRIVTAELEAVLLQPNQAGVAFKPEKKCDGSFLVMTRAVQADAGHDFGQEAADRNARNTNSNIVYVGVMRDTMTRVEVVVVDKRSERVVDHVYFTSRSKSALAEGNSMGVLDDARAIGVKLIEYLAGRIDQANAAR